MKDNTIKKNLLIGICFFAVTLGYFGFQLWNSKKRLEEFNSVLGKTEKIGFSQVVQAALNDNKIGSFQENIMRLFIYEKNYRLYTRTVCVSA